MTLLTSFFLLALAVPASADDCSGSVDVACNGGGHDCIVDVYRPPLAGCPGAGELGGDCDALVDVVCTYNCWRVPQIPFCPLYTPNICFPCDF